MAEKSKPNFTRYSPPKSGPQGGKKPVGGKPSKSFGGSDKHHDSMKGGNGNNTGKRK